MQACVTPSLAIGACHMDATKLLLRVAEVLHKVDGVGNVSLISCLPNAVVHRQAVEEIVESLLVSHSEGGYRVGAVGLIRPLRLIRPIRPVRQIIN